MRGFLDVPDIYSQDVISQIPEPFQTEGNIPAPTTKLTKIILNKISNYRDTVQAISTVIDGKVFFINTTFQCNCKNSYYYDPHNKHIVSGCLLC